MVDEALDHEPGPRQLEAALWTRLEERRGYWALLMLRTAHVLRAGNGGGEWRSFAATAAALLDGWALKKVPIMEHVLSASIAAWQGGGIRSRDRSSGRRAPDPAANRKRAVAVARRAASRTVCRRRTVSAGPDRTEGRVRHPAPAAAVSTPPSPAVRKTSVPVRSPDGPALIDAGRHVAGLPGRVRKGRTACATHGISIAASRSRGGGGVAS